MGSALVGGLLAAGTLPSDITIVEQSAPTRGALSARFPGVNVTDTVPAAADFSGAVLCVKPDVAEGVAALLAAAGVTRLLSVVTGLATQRLEAKFPTSIPVVRSMPNTPVLVRRDRKSTRLNSSH